jgi:hypothetical protein
MPILIEPGSTLVLPVGSPRENCILFSGQLNVEGKIKRTSVPACEAVLDLSRARCHIPSDMPFRRRRPGSKSHTTRMGS